MAEATQDTAQTIDRLWTKGVQRALAYGIVACFILLLAALVGRVIVFGAPTDAVELLKQGFNALINIVMVVAGFYFGSASSSQSKDDRQAAMTEKLADMAAAAPSAAPVVAPAPVIAAWWSLLSDAERGAIEAAAPLNPQLQAFIAAAKVGHAAKADLDYLVARGLLTQARADLIAAS